jgi:hypothetical protein
MSEENRELPGGNQEMGDEVPLDENDYYDILGM